MVTSSIESVSILLSQSVVHYIFLEIWPTLLGGGVRSSNIARNGRRYVNDVTAETFGFLAGIQPFQLGQSFYFIRNSTI